MRSGDGQGCLGPRKCSIVQHPDTGNMEVVHRYGRRGARKPKWAEAVVSRRDFGRPFLMTEPQVASSDATNIEDLRFAGEGDEYIVNGPQMVVLRAVGDPRCKVAIVMGKNRSDGQRPHSQQSQIPGAS